jgi:hypothetical protein
MPDSGMARGSPLSRRTLLLSPLGWLWGSPARAGEVRHLLAGFRREQVFVRRYRVDAAVLFCGFPIFTKRDAGGAYAVVETGGSGESTAVATQFAAGTWPERSANLNRFGVLQEACVESPSGGSAFAFAGLITSSKEEDLEAAKQALKSSVDRLNVTLAAGVCSAGRIQTWIETVASSKPCRWMEAPALLEKLLEESPRNTHYNEVAGATPFLTAMRRAGLSHESSHSRPFVHAGKSFSLEVRWRGQTELDGVIRDGLGAKAAEFQTTYAPADQSGIPIRIEYRAKSFLRLVFQAEDGAARPPVRSLFAEEAI